jgi:hypothetical protein
MAKKNTVFEADEIIEQQEVPEVNTETLEEYIEYDVPMARPGEEQQIFVGFNGRNWLVPCGKKVYLPRKVVINLQQKFRLEAKYEREVAKTYEQDENTRRALG